MYISMISKHCCNCRVHSTTVVKGELSYRTLHDALQRLYSNCSTECTVQCRPESQRVLQHSSRRETAEKSGSQSTPPAEQGDAVQCIGALYKAQAWSPLVKQGAVLSVVQCSAQCAVQTVRSGQLTAPYLNGTGSCGKLLAGAPLEGCS